jgi:deoxyhypusine synthase
MAGPLESPGPVREPVRVAPVDGPGGSVGEMLVRLQAGAFQGRKLGEAFAALRRMIDGPTLICAGLAGSMSSAGLWPLVTWLLDRGYLDLVVSTAANVTEDLLEQRGVNFYRVDPDRVDDRALWEKGFYRFYDHVVSSVEYDRMEDFTATFFEHLAETWTRPAISGARFMLEWGRWLDARGLGGSIAATCARRGVPLFVPAAHDGPLAEGYRTARRRGPAVDFFKDYEIALRIVERSMTPERGTSALFLGGGVPKDFIQIIATSVCAIRGTGEASPHVAAVQITTDNTVFGGLSGASLATECISWGKESPDGDNVMVFADVTIALPLLCQGLYEHYGPGHVRRRRMAPDGDLATLLEEA